METSRFKNLNDIKLYWNEGREHPLMEALAIGSDGTPADIHGLQRALKRATGTTDTLLFLVTYIEELEKNIRKLEGWRD
jgi:hypothetical protein